MVMPKQLDANIGDNVMFVCSYNDEIEWKFEDGDLPPNVVEIGDKKSGGINIFITNIENANIGRYKCKTKDTLGGFAKYDIGVLKLKECTEGFHIPSQSKTKVKALPLHPPPHYVHQTHNSDIGILQPPHIRLLELPKDAKGVHSISGKRGREMKMQRSDVGSNHSSKSGKIVSDAVGVEKSSLNIKS